MTDERQAWRGLARVLASRRLEGPVAEGGDSGGRVYHHLTLLAPEVAAAAVPGQFVHVLCPPRSGAGGAPYAPASATPGLPFLRRPLSVHDADQARGTVGLLFWVKGPGTVGLAAARPGDRLDVVGPLGNGGFPLGLGPALVVGGGIGLAPLLFLARRLARRGRVTVLAGVAQAGDLALVEPFRRLKDLAGLIVTTEDGSPGTVSGTVVAALPESLDGLSPDGHSGAVYACGPRPMLRAVWDQVSARPGLTAWFSVEERLACGVGACRGCAIPVRTGPAGETASPPDPGRAPDYRLVCRDGPVFDGNLLDWEAL